MDWLHLIRQSSFYFNCPINCSQSSLAFDEATTSMLFVFGLCLKALSADTLPERVIHILKNLFCGATR